MRWERPNSLGKSVEARATNRPVKIAYLVPFDDTPQTHMNLDAVFFESYTRWAGVYTLVIPTKPQEFMVEGYDGWLKRYDPDFIYSYIDLDDAFVDKIDHLCCPIAFLKHEKRNSQDHKIDWRTYLPRWDHYIQPISSISTVQTPVSYPQFPYRERPREPTIFTQYMMEPANRFLADNFGTGFSLTHVTHAIPEFFNTLCLVPANLPPNIIAGTERCFSTLEALCAISDNRATPIAVLAMAYSSGMPRLEIPNWTSCFRLFIGSSPLDRIHFWNCRHLGNSWSDTPTALILEPSLFDDAGLVRQLGQYLNKHNFLGVGNGPRQAAMQSSSLSHDTLSILRGKLIPHTWNTIYVNETFNAPPIPSQMDLDGRSNEDSSDATTIRLTEDSNKIIATEPAHFVYIPAKLKGHTQGQWIVDLNIQRHNNLSKYSNVVDTWALPRSRKIASAFTGRLAKPTLRGHLALVPSTASVSFRNPAINLRNSYEIHLPSDETFFRHLALKYSQTPADDIRAAIPRTGYTDLAISDKGQNLRGVISMFEHLSAAFGILTNKYWRAVLAEAKEDSNKPLTFDRNKLDSLIPNDQGTMQRLTQELHFDDINKTKYYLRDSLTDTLEYLVRLNVFYQVASWRCRYCGHSNLRNFDNMKIRNTCEICATEYFTPIDTQWQYALNDFVYRSLQKHSGLPVLWTLGYLQDRMHSGSFWYLPEVDLYDRDEEPQSKNEIDLLAMVDGAFYAAEVKSSASIFLNKDGSIEKFLKMIGLLRPDIALLAFENFCTEAKDVETTRARLGETGTRIREQISPCTKLEILVAQDIHAFNDFPVDLGWFGRRTQKYYQNVR